MKTPPRPTEISLSTDTQHGDLSFNKSFVNASNSSTDPGLPGDSSIVNASNSSTDPELPGNSSIVNASVSGHALMEESGSLSRPPKHFHDRSELAGQGVNGYTLRVLDDRDDGLMAVKAFFTPEARDEARAKLEFVRNDYPNLDRVVAGLHHASYTFSFDDQCLYADQTRFGGEWNCYWLKMEWAGSHTLTQCLRSSGIEQAQQLLAEGMGILRIVHGEHFYHSDAHPDNFMLDDYCTPSSMKLIDLDDFQRYDPRTSDWGYSFDYHMMKDYVMLLTIQEMAPGTLTHFNRQLEPLERDLDAAARDGLDHPWMYEGSRGEITGHEVEILLDRVRDILQRRYY